MKVPDSPTVSSWNESLLSRRTSDQWLSTSFRVPRFQLFEYITRYTLPQEVKKVALYKDRRFAWFHTILHLFPFTAATALVVLNLKSTYIGSAQNDGVIALQFAAKLLEVLTQASIAATTLGIIRQHVLQTQGIPFGGLMAPYRTNDLSYLWSLDFWGCVTSEALSVKRKIMFCLTIFMAVLLASLVGPSSAVLMIPRPMLSPEQGSVWLLDPVNQVYPATVGLQANGTLREEFLYNLTSIQAVNNAYRVWPVPIVDAGSPRGMKWSWQMLADDDDTTILRSLATAPTLLFSEATRRLSLPGANSALATQPYVYVDCWSSGEATVITSNDSFVDFGPRKTYLNNYLNLSTLLPAYENSLEDQSLAIYHSDLTGYENTISGDDLARNLTAVWSNPPTGQNNNSLLMVTAIHEGTNSTFNNSSMKVSISACTVDAYWASVPGDASTNLLAQSDLPRSQEDAPLSALADLKDRTLIELTPEWAKEALVSIAERVDAEGILNAFGTCAVPLALALSYVPQWQNYTNTFDNIPETSDYVPQEIWHNNSDMSDQQNNALLHYIDTLNLPSTYAVYVLTNDTTWTDPTQLAQIRFTSFNSGYGYNMSSTTVKLSVAVILVYLVVTTAYVLYSVSTGYAASSWNSIAELTALALNSERPKVLVNTSVGIDTLETYRRPINIRVNQQDSLEIVFDESEQTKGYTQVAVNERY